MKYVELFAGVGGFRIGIEKAFPKAQCVYSNEWDKHAAETYKKHFGEIDTRDITTVRPEEIPAHDLICAGFPCQAFSVAGKRRGFDETRGTLFFEIMRIARYHRSPYLLLENVKGLLSHDSGRTFETIIRTMDELGYDLQWEVLNSKDFGVPQNRERVFIVGHLRGRPRPEVFPIEPPGEGSTESKSEPRPSASPALRAREGGVTVKEQLVTTTPGFGTDDRVADERGLSPTLISVAKDHRGHQGGVGKRVPIVAQGINHPSRGIEPRKDGLAATIKSGESGTQKPKALVGEQIRRLTPVECERLQGFPDGWTAGQSDTQRYKQMGNAVTVNVIEAVASKLCQVFK